MTGDDARNWPTIVVPGRKFALILGLLLLSVVSDLYLADPLDLDLRCLNDTRGRRGWVVEGFLCALGAGPKGWLFIAWFAWPLALLGYWLHRSVRREKQPVARCPDTPTT